MTTANRKARASLNANSSKYILTLCNVACDPIGMFTRALGRDYLNASCPVHVSVPQHSVSWYVLVIRQFKL